jgi:hypothetical protein
MTPELAEVIRRSELLARSDRLDTALRLLTEEAKSDTGFVLVYATLVAISEMLLKKGQTAKAKQLAAVSLAAYMKRKADLETVYEFPELPKSGFGTHSYTPAPSRKRSVRASSNKGMRVGREDYFGGYLAERLSPDIAGSDPTAYLTPHLDITPAGSRDDLIVVDVYLDNHDFAAGEFGEKVGAPHGTEVLVQLFTTKHFEIVGSGVATFLFDSKAKRIDMASFHLRVAAVPDDDITSPAITALFSVNGRPCGKIARSVKFDGTPVEIVALAAVAFNVEPAVVDPASLTVTIISNPTNDGRQFFCTVSSPHLSDIGPSDWNLPSSAQSLVSGFMNKFTASTKSSQMIAELVGAGKLLFEAAPENFRRAFWALIDGNRPLTSIAIVSEEAYIPWELMVPTRQTAAGLEERANPIGVDFAIGRWILKVQSPSRKISIDESIVIAPEYAGGNVLINAQKEAELVSGQFRGPIVRPADFEAVALALVSKYSLLHFVCHGKDKALDGQAIDLDDSDELTTGNLRGIEGIAAAFRSKAPVVFLNACEVGRGSPALVGPGGFASQFITLGARAVIAPLWSVEDSVAHDIALEFYEALERDPTTPLANIFSRVRAKAYVQGSGKDTYAAYCFFGDPLAVLS